MKLEQKEFCNQVREICKKIENEPWNKIGIYANTYADLNITIGLNQYNEILNDTKHPLRKYLNINNQNK
jgi:hypothetical protein